MFGFSSSRELKKKASVLRQSCTAIDSVASGVKSLFSLGVAVALAVVRWVVGWLRGRKAGREKENLDKWWQHYRYRLYRLEMFCFCFCPKKETEQKRKIRW